MQECTRSIAVQNLFLGSEDSCGHKLSQELLKQLLTGALPSEETTRHHKAKSQCAKPNESHPLIALALLGLQALVYENVVCVLVLLLLLLFPFCVTKFSSVYNILKYPALAETLGVTRADLLCLAYPYFFVNMY